MRLVVPLADLRTTYSGTDATDAGRLVYRMEARLYEGWRSFGGEARTCDGWRLLGRVVTWTGTGLVGIGRGELCGEGKVLPHGQ
jgi:hypothetical protein